jgi:hypothetical protein
MQPEGCAAQNKASRLQGFKASRLQGFPSEDCGRGKLLFSFLAPRKIVVGTGCMEIFRKLSPTTIFRGPLN